MIAPTRDWLLGAIDTIRLAYAEGVHRPPTDADLAEWLMNAFGGLTGPEIIAAVRYSPEGVAAHAHKSLRPLESYLPLSTDICGMRLPAIKPFGTTDVVFTAIQAAYPPEIRAMIIALAKVHRYNCLVVDPRPKYHGVYPSKVCSVDEFRTVLQEIADADLLPIPFWIPDDRPFNVGEWDATIGPYLADRTIRSLSMINGVGWEMNGPMTVPEMEAAIRWVRAHVDPAAEVYPHFTQNHAAGSGNSETEQRWWLRLTRENQVNGIFLQLAPDASVADQAARIEDFTVRLVGGLNQWPTVRGDGKPVRVFVFEYDAFAQVNGRMTEAEGQTRRTVFEHLPGVSGVLDQP